MIDIYKKTELNKLLNKHDFKISKSLGQNFLTDKNIIDKIINGLNINKDDNIIEIGPGVGALTAELTKVAKSVKSIEIDNKLIPLLKEVVNDAQIINEDFMDVNLETLTEGKPYKLIGNLPYYITTPIIMKVLEEGPRPETMVFMVQKEVAMRLSAKAGSKDYGAISVVCGYYCNVEYLFTVSSQVFVPKPKVDSAVIRMTPHTNPPVILEDEDMFFSVIKAGFGQRRKTLSNSLKQISKLSADQVKEALLKSDIDPKRRAETLDINQFARLSNTVTSLLKNNS